MTKKEDERAAQIIQEAQDRWKVDYDWEHDSRMLAMEDYKFACGDSENNFQWPENVQNDRGGPSSAKPMLTINKVRQNNLQIINDARKNKPAITFRPVGNGATAQSAQIWNGLARRIESQSMAQSIYDRATEYLVKMGFGFWRITTEYVNENTFDQEIYIRPVVDPWSCLLDSNAKLPDRSDARHGFLSEDVARDDFELKYPQFKDIPPQLALTEGGNSWVTKDKIRVAEYYRQEQRMDTLYAYVPQDAGTTAPVMIYKSDLKDPAMLERVKSGAKREREVMRLAVRWYLIVGSELVDEADWPSKYVPLVQIVGEETIIDNQFDRKGHTRYLKDPQRMYNYFSSGAVEYGALQTKTPWIATVEAIEEHENDWNSANTENKSVLVYNGFGDDGTTKIEAPSRVQPPVSAPLCVDGMKIASDEIMTASGQYAATMGGQGNERSAKAIMERQRQGDTATYHFIDALSIGVRKTGKIMMDLAPKIYDTKRIIQIIQEDGKTLEVQMDPGAKKAYEEQQLEDQAAVERIFNPAVGTYEVLIDVGPDWGTKREEAFNAFSMLLGQAPNLIPYLADLLMRAGDFPMAETAAERLYRMLPAQAKGEGPSPQEQALTQQIDALKEALSAMIQEKSKLQLTLKGKEQQKFIDAFNAVTQRLKVVGERAMDAGQMKQLVETTLREALGIPIEPVTDASEPTLEAAAQEGAGVGGQLPLALEGPAIPRGARMGADGRTYMRDLASAPGYRPV